MRRLWARRCQESAQVRLHTQRPPEMAMQHLQKGCRRNQRHGFPRQTARRADDHRVLCDVGRTKFARRHPPRQRHQGRNSHCLARRGCTTDGTDRRGAAQGSQNEPRATRCLMDLRLPQRRKKGVPEEDERGTFWRGTAIETETRLRVGRAIAKTEEEVAQKMMEQIKERGHQEAPPAIATDGKGAYREAMVETWGPRPTRERQWIAAEPETTTRGLAVRTSRQTSRRRPSRAS